MIESPLHAFWLGRRPYQAIHDLQLALQAQRIAGAGHDLVLLLEHDPVITLGRRADRQHIVASGQLLTRQGVQIVQTGRGGDVTFHGPGQLVAYPIISLPRERQDVRKYVGALIDTMAGLASARGVQGGVIREHPGLWVDTASPHRWTNEQSAKRPAKIGAVGVRLSHWVTMHGFAFNSFTSLEAFSWIIPCGIADYGVTSLASLGASSPSPDQLAPEAASLLADRLGLALASFVSVESISDNLLGSALGL